MEEKTNYFTRVMSSKPDDVLADIVGNVSGYDEDARLAAAWELEKRGKANTYTRAVESSILERSGKKRPEILGFTTNNGDVLLAQKPATTMPQPEGNLLLPYPETNTLVLASAGKRFTNLLIDYIASLLFAGFAFFNIGLIFELLGNESFQEENAAVDNLLAFFFTLSYYFICEHALNGRTIGKMLTRTRVLDENGNKPSAAQIVGRTCARMIPFEAFTFLGEDARGWHDSLANTIVIDEKKSVLKSDWL